MAYKFPSFLAFILDNPIRAFFADRETLIKRTGIKKGETVLEPGCGSGFFTPVLSKAAGEKGKVIAVDLQEDMIGKLRNKIRKKNLINVETLVSDIGEINLMTGSIDFIFAYYCYHEFENKLQTAKKFKEVLKDQGNILISEPRFEVKFKMKEKMKEIFNKEGLILTEEWETFFSYYLKFKKFQV